ncbi:hypothetical protein [Neorhodopirellula lusitana]|uniref:hypothetical protein n=1 Tax=Neorhodopirellula lusitana TaxID=445327 RepID=UPI00384C9A20
MNWFETLTGIAEESPEQVRDQLSIQDERIVCPNGNRLPYGRLELPKLSELRKRVSQLPTGGRTQVRECVGDAKALHADPANAKALFQVASQFNLLEMVSPTVTPERGVGIYEHDHTQGPTCAIACGSGTIYRNYFAPVPVTDVHSEKSTIIGQTIIGQSSSNQLDCVADLGRSLGNNNGELWSMQNGYLFPTDSGLAQITATLQSATDAKLEQLQGELRIGMQWQTPVTLTGAKHLVSQAYCSALPVAYGNQPVDDWADFAKLILDAAYESTLCVAIQNATETGSNKLFLTLLGGGVFGNRDEWIISAIDRALTKYRDHNLDVAIVSYARSQPIVADFVSRW